MKVTIKDLANESGYTVATVSRALNNNPLVSEKTRLRVLRIAEEMGYMPNALARGLVTKRSLTIGVIIPDITNPYFPTIVKAVQDTLKNKGYITILCNSDWIADNELDMVKMLYEHQVSGIIMDPLSDDSLINIRKAGIRLPIVFTGNKTEDEDISYVMIDNYNAAKKSAEYLYGLGHRKIAFVGGMENTNVNRNRFSGYRDTIIAHFGNMDEKLVQKCKYKIEDGYNAARQFVMQGNIPTAVIAGNDIIAFGIIEGFRESGLNVPQDVSVIGFDDIEYASIIGLTTIREPRYKIGSTAAQILMSIIDNQPGPFDKTVVFEPELIKRKTCTKVS